MTAVALAEAPARAPATPAGPLLRELASLSDLELLGIFRSEPPASQRRAAACEVLVARYRPLVRSCAGRYWRRPELAEDLLQVGYLGLVKAISRFDPAAGGSLAAYAQVTVSGELKRHFRDTSWPLHVSRPVKELAMDVRAATAQLSQDLGRTPAEPDLARYLGVTPAALREAERAETAYAPRSLDALAAGRPDAGPVASRLGAIDPALERVLGMSAVAAHWAELPAREQRVLLLRFYGDMSQAQIGAQIGVSQMQVSRILSSALGYLRPRVFGTAAGSARPTAAAPAAVRPAPEAGPESGRPEGQLRSPAM